ncbi:hypothetical protein [Mucilaginibacter sp.]|uniref:hypothetical protein n=1 Tax=Mucilaginibacter sp. TaxID=1882438 RepID=UPI0025FC5DD2|nr:hypothetical protein [Mucilaginibacter sp.]
MFYIKSFYSALILGLLLSQQAICQNTPQINIQNSNWVATDALGRNLPTYKETGAPKPNTYVGVFYWLWHGDLRSTATNTDSVNVTKILALNPLKTDWRPEDYYWDESEFGYYRSADPWVIKRHLALMAAAGVDFIFLDLTNGEVYEPEIKTLLATIQNLRKRGVKAPYVVPFLNSEYGWKVQLLYNNFYKPGNYDDVWFYWNGKPLIMSPKVKVDDIKDKTQLAELLNYYTWRPTWALFDDDRGAGGKWRFMDTHPQRVALDSLGRAEQYVVSKSMGAPLWNYRTNGSSDGLHYVATVDKYWLSKETGTGIFLNEQWNRADSVHAPILLVTGWNEFKAGAWPTSKELAATKGFAFEDKKMKEGDLYFVDEFNREFNRDLEPIKNGYTDNFYYQFVARMRKYKGMMPPQPASVPISINLKGDFSDWKGVMPIYTNTLVNGGQRNFAGVLPGLHYNNNTGRNHIIESRTARDSKCLYFYAKTDSTITPHTGANWMLLFINADQNKKTGWEGYDYLINADVKSNNKTTLKKWVKGKWQTIALIDYEVIGSQIMLKMPLSLIHQTKNNLSFNFHWIDNIQRLNDINEFFVNGDSAPLRRFDYHYTTNK